MRLDGCSAVVSGGASGLGLATVSLLTNLGAKVAALDLPSEGAHNRVSAAGGTLIAADVTDAEAVEQAVASLPAPLRVAVCCAGIIGPGRVQRAGVALPLERFTQVVQVNLVGSFNVLRVAAAAMSGNDPVDGDRGVIVLTSSVAAFEGQVGQAGYAASKAGVAGMVLPVARDLADAQIRVMGIAPGTFGTPMLSGLPEPTKAQLARDVPHPARVGEPSEFAALVGHIVSNGMLNGEVIRLDGALRMAPR